MRLSTIAWGASLVVASVKAQSQNTPTQPPASLPTKSSSSSAGCFSSQGNMTMAAVQIPGEQMSTGACIDNCKGARGAYWVAAMHGGQCLCGYALPPKNSITSDSDCSIACSSYPKEACGGLKAYSVYYTGVEVLVDSYVEPASSQASGVASSTTPSTPSDTSRTSPIAGVTTTQPATPTDTSQSKSGPNVAGVAAGVVLGVLTGAGAIGGLFFYIRRKRNAEIEEEHRRNAAVNHFIGSSKPPSSRGSISMTDSRLDPVMAHRRMSDGSIADNEDYSRRILRVTNA